MPRRNLLVHDDLSARSHYLSTSQAKYDGGQHSILQPKPVKKQIILLKINKIAVLTIKIQIVASKRLENTLCRVLEKAITYIRATNKTDL